MKRSPSQLWEDALAIWRAGVDAVASDRLVREHVCVDGTTLQVADAVFDLDAIDRIMVVGAGKAGAGMAAGLEDALGEAVLASKQVAGWINVPADCLRPLKRIHLHAARDAGVNEPSGAGVRGAEEILQIVESATERDLVICLLSGGGSALLPSPVDGVSLEDKQQVTRFLSAAGANIQQLNTVRKHLSRIKGGGLARASCAGQLVTQIISDVPGDPLDVIASGPTVADSTTAEDALAILEQFGAREAELPQSIFTALAQQATVDRPDIRSNHNYIIGNNATAVDAAGIEAERRGYSHAMHASVDLKENAEDAGRQLAKMAVRMRDQSGPDCLITGGEPVVQLIEEEHRGTGGRNQQLVLAALVQLLESENAQPMEGICLLSGGTDGEDGPTDAAGAMIDEMIAEKCGELTLTPAEFLRRNDAYHFFQRLDGLLKTGPTHTNVCDLRVVCVDRVEQA